MQLALELLAEHQEVFSGDLGKLRGYKAKIYVDPKAQLKFIKARSVPHSMRTGLNNRCP